MFACLQSERKRERESSNFVYIYREVTGSMVSEMAELGQLIRLQLEKFSFQHEKTIS